MTAPIIRNYLNIMEDGANRYKAGMIPYYVEPDGTLRMLFVRSSNPAFGGPDPAIAKGNSDGDTDPRVTALREIGEETGLPAAAIKKMFVIFDGKISGLIASYRMVIYAGMLDGPPQLKPHDYEIAEVLWMTPEEFATKGRASHRHIVNQLVNKVQAG